jgi:5-methylcytosine-specific restriction endonuclease McrA
MCEWDGCDALADEVDHIVPLSEGGDPYGFDNLRSLCRRHHIERHQGEVRWRKR